MVPAATAVAGLPVRPTAEEPEGPARWSDVGLAGRRRRRLPPAFGPEGQRLRRAGVVRPGEPVRRRPGATSARGRASPQSSEAEGGAVIEEEAAETRSPERGRGAAPARAVHREGPTSRDRGSSAVARGRARALPCPEARPGPVAPRARSSRSPVTGSAKCGKARRSRLRRRPCDTAVHAGQPPRSKGPCHLREKYYPCYGVATTSEGGAANCPPMKGFSTRWRELTRGEGSTGQDQAGASSSVRREMIRLVVDEGRGAHAAAPPPPARADVSG